MAVDWAAVLARRAAGRPADVRVPAAAVLAAAGRGAGGGGRGVGLVAVGHPLLGAAVELAGGEGYLLTGLLSVRAQPWLADHAVAGTVLLPGTAFVEMAIRAGDAAGCGRVEELTLEAPLVLPADGAVRVQVVVGGPDASGGRAVSVYARPADAAADGRGPGTPAGGWPRPEPPGARGGPGARGVAAAGRGAGARARAV